MNLKRPFPWIYRENFHIAWKTQIRSNLGVGDLVSCRKARYLRSGRMRGKLGLIPFLLAVLATSVVAQDPTVRRDTQFPVELRTTIKSDKAKVGDKVEFQTREAVLIGNNIVVPERAKILGRIEQIRSGATESPRSLVDISIHTLKWKNGEAALNAVVFSVEATPAENMVMRRRRHPFFKPPNFLQGIRIRAHLKRDARTDFFSESANFTLHSGLLFLLRQIDPEHVPGMMGHENILDIGTEN